MIKNVTNSDRALDMDTMLTISAVRSLLQFRRSCNILPWLGPVLRGGLGGILRSLSCRVNGVSNCAGCPLVRTCAYGYVFETPIPIQNDSARVHTHAPHPFAIRTPMLDHVKGDEIIAVDLILIGKGVEYLPYLLIAFKELGRRGIGKERGHFIVIETRCVKTGLLIDENDGLGEELAFTVDPCGSDCSPSYSRGTMKVIFASPVRIKISGEPMHSFVFDRFLLSIVSRVEDLAWYHCKQDLRGSMGDLVKLAKSVTLTIDETQYIKAWRGSSRQKRFIPVGGLVGRASFSGNLQPLTGLFQAAEYVGVGGKTSFGLGAVRFEPHV